VALGQRLTHLSESAARETAGVGVNIGLYNGFLGLALLWATFALGEREAYSFQWLLLTFIVVAGVVGAISIKNRAILVLQSLPALVALGLIWFDRPYPRTEDQAISDIIKIERQILSLKSANVQPNPLPKVSERPTEARDGEWGRPAWTAPEIARTCRGQIHCRRRHP